MIRISEAEREYAALTTMRLMLDAFSLEKGISFDDAMRLFTTSPAYIALFNYETGLWKEGPDYLRSFWNQCVSDE